MAWTLGQRASGLAVACRCVRLVIIDTEELGRKMFASIPAQSWPMDVPWAGRHSLLGRERGYVSANSHQHAYVCTPPDESFQQPNVKRAREGREAAEEPQQGRQCAPPR